MPLCRITSDSKLDNVVVPADSLSCILNCQSIDHKFEQIMNNISWQFGRFVKQESITVEPK